MDESSASPSVTPSLHSGRRSHCSVDVIARSRRRGSNLDRRCARSSERCIGGFMPYGPATPLGLGMPRMSPPRQWLTGPLSPTHVLRSRLQPSTLRSPAGPVYRPTPPAAPWRPSVLCRKALGEPCVDGRQQFVRFADPTVVAHQPGVRHRNRGAGRMVRIHFPPAKSLLRTRFGTRRSTADDIGPRRGFPASGTS